MSYLEGSEVNLLVFEGNLSKMCAPYLQNSVNEQRWWRLPVAKSHAREYVQRAQCSCPGLRFAAKLDLQKVSCEVSVGESQPSPDRTLRSPRDG